MEFVGAYGEEVTKPKTKQDQEICFCRIAICKCSSTLNTQQEANTIYNTYTNTHTQHHKKKKNTYGPQG